MPWILNIYFARLFGNFFLMVFFIMGLASFLLTLGETFNQKFIDLSPNSLQLIMFALMQTPDHLHTVMPLTVLLAAIAFFLNIARSQQLLMAIQSGASTIKLLFLTIVLVSGIGIITVTLINPLAADLLSRYEKIVHNNLEENESLLSVANTGIWLRQKTADYSYIVHASNIGEDQNSFHQVSIFEYKNNIFLRRIEAKQALIEDDSWLLQDVVIYIEGGFSDKAPNFLLKIDIDREKITNSFSTVESIPLWQLNQFIDAVENAGFDAKEHIAHLHRVLSAPVLMLAMFLLAGCFCAQAHERRLPHFLILGAIAIGFGYFVFSTTFQSLGIFHEWPILLIIWLPHLLFLLSTLTYILHQDSLNH